MATISLVKSAFGSKATLYTALNCTKKSSQSELRSAYRRAALRFHPDRSNYSTERSNSSSNGDGDTTLQFQAVSAAYQVLMDDRRRAVYDTTGRVLDEDADNASYGSSSDNKGNQQEVPSGERRSNAQRQRQWEEFFQSIFNEIISTGCEHEANARSYPGSAQERDDVLKYYKMCRGNMQKVLECVLHATQDDVGRWHTNIIEPAIRRGEVDDFFKEVSITSKVIASKTNSNSTMKQSMTLEDSSSSEDDGPNKPKRLRKLPPVKGNKVEPQQPSEASMSMREKLDYRVAKKRKVKVEKEMEFSKMIRSKKWDTDKMDSNQSPKNRGGVSDQLLSQIERKYATKSNLKRRKRKKR